jgi:hypothetical protein
MYEDYIDFGIEMRVYLGDFEAFDVVEIDSGALCFHVIVSLVCPVLYSTRIGLHGLAMLVRCSPCSVYRIRCIRPGPGNGLRLFIYDCSSALPLCHD